VICVAFTNVTKDVALDVRIDSLEKALHICAWERFGGRVRGDSHGLAKKHGWVVSQKRSHDVHLFRGQPPGHLSHLVSAFFGVLCAHTIVANKRDRDGLKEFVAS
jgi:hypothetical protein